MNKSLHGTFAIEQYDTPSLGSYDIESFLMFIVRLVRGAPETEEITEQYLMENQRRRIGI